MSDYLFVFQGSGQDDDLGPKDDTAPIAFSKRYLDGDGRVSIHSGVGTRAGWFSVVGLVFGVGAQDRVNEAVASWENEFGRPEVIDVIAWSRGAAEAVEFCRRMEEQDVQVRFLGLFDCVYSMAWPWWVRAIPSNVNHCCHAMARDEWRKWTFPVTRFTLGGDTDYVAERWFPGNHSDIGGHPGVDGPALKWMFWQGGSLGLPVDVGRLELFLPVDSSRFGRGRSPLPEDMEWSPEVLSAEARSE